MQRAKLAHLFYLLIRNIWMIRYSLPKGCQKVKIDRKFNRELA